MITDGKPRQPQCPTCGGMLVLMGSREVGIDAADGRGRRAYSCTAGCRGPEPDGTFEFIKCPACGSESLALPRGGDIEELACSRCGTITSLQIGPSSR